MPRSANGRYFIENYRVREAELERDAERCATEHDEFPRMQRFAWIWGLFTRGRPTAERGSPGRHS